MRQQRTGTDGSWAAPRGGARVEQLGTEPAESPVYPHRSYAATVATDAQSPLAQEGSQRRRTGPFAAGVVLAVLAGLIGVLAVGIGDEDSVSSSLVGRVAPPVDGPSLYGGEFVEQPGRYVVVNFFAPWCAPCRQEHPELAKFEQQHEGSRQASVVSVAYSTSPGAAVEFFEDNDGVWPLLDDPDGSTALRFGVVKLPETYVISPAGVVVAKFAGAVTADQLNEIVLRR